MRGTIKQRSKGSWTIILDMGRDPTTGKRQQSWTTIRGTKKEAERKLSELLVKKDTGGNFKPSKLTVGQFLEQWLANYAETNVRPRTLEGYRDIIRTHLIPNLGGLPLAELKADHIRTYSRVRSRMGGRTARADCLPARLPTTTDCSTRL